MPGSTTPNALPYPYENETVDDVSIKNLADAVDAKFNTSITNATATTKRPAALVKRDTGTQSFATGAALANLTFTTELYDNNGMGNLGTNNERLTIATNGVYLVSATAILNGGAAEQDVTTGVLVITVNGTVVSGWKGRWVTTITVPLVKRLVAGDVVRAQYQWIGVNSPKNITYAALGARWLCS